MSKIFILAALLMAGELFSQEAQFKKTFTPAELKQDLDFLFTTLENIHPNLYHYTSREIIMAARLNVEQALNEPMTRLEFSRKLIPVVSLLKDGHTSLSFPQEERNNFLKQEGKVFPFDVLIRDNRLFITNNYSTDSTISKFAEISSINGIGTPALLDQLRPYVSAELDHFRDIRIQRIFRGLLWNALGFDGDYELELVGQNQLSNHHVTGITAKEFQAIANAKAPPFYLPNKPYTLQLTSEKIAVIDFRSMMDKKRFEKFLDSAFRVIKKENIEHLVIDVRNNGGGNSRLGDMLFNYITDKPYRQVDRMEVKASREMKTNFRKQHLKWYMYPVVPLTAFHKQARYYFFARPGKIHVVEMQKLQTPKNEKLKFKGSTYLLTSHYTFSSANMLAAAFKCFSMGTIVGEETGGVLTAFGDIIPIELPNTKLTAWCSYKKFVHPCADDRVHGVKPDVEIIPTSEDILAGRDAVLEYVKNIALYRE
jgi:hypothetical protein